jgi:multiple sugar transport system substrate-binding protein
MSKVMSGIVIFMSCLSFVFGRGNKQQEVPEGRIGIEYFLWGDATEQENTRNLVQQYNNSQDRIWLMSTVVPLGEYMTKLNTLAATGSLPDVAIIHDDYVLSWAARGMMADVSDMFDREDFKVFDEAVFKYKGKPVASGISNNIAILYYNKDIFDNAGLPYPPSKAEDAWTWDQFVDIAKRLTKDSTGKTPFDAGFNPNDTVNYGVSFNYTPWILNGFAVSNGGGFWSEDHKTLTINSPETSEAMQSIADLFVKDHCAPNPSTGLGDSAMGMLSGKVAMAIDGHWAIGLTYSLAAKEGLNYSVGVLPKFKKPITTNTSPAVCVFKSTKHLVEAKEVAMFLSKPEGGMAAILQGICQPTIKSWYTDEKKIKEWVVSPLKPPLEDYRHAVIEYTLNNLVESPLHYFSKWPDFLSILYPAMDPVWQGRKTAKAALDQAFPALKRVFDSAEK